MTKGTTSAGYVWRPWKVVAMGMACLLTIAGGVLAISGNGDSPTPETTSASATPAAGASRVDVPGARGFDSEVPPISLPDESSGTPPDETAAFESSTGETEAGGESPWTPALLRGGLSFLVGFSLAYAARTFIKIAVFFLGVWAASLFLLSSLGWVEVHWHVIDAAFEGWSSRLGEQFESAKAFITGSLPSTGMAGLGLFTGFRRK